MNVTIDEIIGSIRAAQRAVRNCETVANFLGHAGDLHRQLVLLAGLYQISDIKFKTTKLTCAGAKKPVIEPDLSLEIDSIKDQAQAFVLKPLG